MAYSSPMVVTSPGASPQRGERGGVRTQWGWTAGCYEVACGEESGSRAETGSAVSLGRARTASGMIGLESKASRGGEAREEEEYW